MSDLISRQDVFEIIDKAFSQPMRNGVTLYADICLMLNALPTHANSRSTHERDLISRQDAIEAKPEYRNEDMLDKEKSTYNKGWNDCNDAWVAIIKAIPSAVCDDCIWHVCNYNKVDWDAPSAEAVQGDG